MCTAATAVVARASLQFSLGPAEFIDAWCREGPTHHFALGVGHILPRIEKFASLAALELRVVAA